MTGSKTATHDPKEEKVDGGGGDNETDRTTVVTGIDVYKKIVYLVESMTEK